MLLTAFCALADEEGIVDPNKIGAILKECKRDIGGAEQLR